MMRHLRILGIAFSFLLASASDGLAAGKRRAGSRGRPPAQTRELPPKPAPQGTADVEVGKTKSGPSDPRGSENRGAIREAVRQESRIEFDERMLRGQSAAGVIYLFQRTPSDWKSIVEVPDSFRARTTDIMTPAQEKK
jgi:hypothetical protein